MSDIAVRAGIAFAGWALLLGLTNPFFRDRVRRHIMIVCAIVASVLPVVGPSLPATPNTTEEPKL